MAAQKRTEYERESDLLFLHDLRLRRMQPAEILRRLNRRQQDRAMAAAREVGMSEEQGAEVARAAGLSHQSMCRDFRTIQERMRVGSRAAGELLLRERIDELEMERQATLLIEQEAWTQWEASCREEVRETRVTEPVELPPEAPGGQPQRVLRPKEYTRTTVNRTGEARFLAQVIQCMELRLRISQQQFELAGLLAIDPPADLKGLRDGDGSTTARALLAAEIEWLYRAEARGLGAGADERRLKLLTSFASRRDSRGGAAAAGTGSFTFQVEELPVEQPS